MSAIVRVEDMHKSFGEITVFSGFTLGFEEGQITTVVGQSGTGKSVLLKCILGLIVPEKGSVYFEDQEIGDLTGEQMLSLRRNFGYSFQHDALFDSMTVRDNIAFPLKEVKGVRKKRQINSRVEELLDWIELPGVEKQLPAELSGGQRKRIGIARALAIEPKVLLFDEPTSGLDPILAETIHDLVVRINGELGLTCIFVTHDIPAALRISDTIVVLHEGEVVAQGGADDILSSDHPIVKQFVENAFTSKEAAAVEQKSGG